MWMFRLAEPIRLAAGHSSSLAAMVVQRFVSAALLSVNPGGADIVSDVGICPLIGGCAPTAQCSRVAWPAWLGVAVATACACAVLAATRPVSTVIAVALIVLVLV